jgi:hypothetical protein
MDVYCPFCSEPWENDHLHEVAKAKRMTYRQVWADFRKRGCPAVEDGAGPDEVCTYGNDKDPRPTAIAAIYTMSGDDPDSAAEMLRDLGLIG